MLIRIIPEIKLIVGASDILSKPSASNDPATAVRDSTASGSTRTSAISFALMSADRSAAYVVRRKAARISKRFDLLILLRPLVGRFRKRSGKEPLKLFEAHLCQRIHLFGGSHSSSPSAQLLWVKQAKRSSRVSPMSSQGTSSSMRSKTKPHFSMTRFDLSLESSHTHQRR